MTRRAVGALCAVTAIAAFTGCTEELHRYGAMLRGAPVNVSYRGHPYYTTGGATRSYSSCIDVVNADPTVPDWTGPHICQANYEWVEGSVGYRTDLP